MMRWRILTVTGNFGLVAAEALWRAFARVGWEWVQGLRWPQTEDLGEAFYVRAPATQWQKP